MNKQEIESDADAIKLLRAKLLAEALDAIVDTLREWQQCADFPDPIFIRDGSPARWRLAEVRRWLDGRQRRRHKPIHRGAVKEQQEVENGQ